MNVMKSVRFLVGLVAAASLATAARAAAQLDAYGDLPSIESVEISPDGSKLAVAISSGEISTDSIDGRSP